MVRWTGFMVSAKVKTAVPVLSFPPTFRVILLGPLEIIVLYTSPPSIIVSLLWLHASSLGGLGFEEGEQRVTIILSLPM